ncbi:LpqB family beta-propeller domain-containing protein [Sphaerisporangium fuscum]|uniref:LpqB family beta-propeller domain-containing protein n=1 Tax=Sphaerisporangium fuscum TaxID=2835868 RepID=UPI001BDBC902|nr:LpqB family beta-propeller domain-containing protein [Sphaerisporangium fuscum]
MLALIIVAVTSASCAGAPTGGAIFSARGKGQGDPLSQPYVRIIASAPKPQASPIDIVDGFLAAAASFDDPLRTVARQYLTGEAQRTWSPFDSVTVYDQGEAKSDASRDDIQQAHVTLKGNLLGTLDTDNHYVPNDASSGNELNKGFTLVKVGGEWRISSAPPGLLLSNDDFKRAYRSFSLYYPAYHSPGLVADQVRVSINPGVGLAKALVHRLTEGPTTPLRGAVESAFGPNVDVNKVSVEGDTVVVDFTYGIVDSVQEQENKEALSAQLSWTLKPLTESRRIEVQVNGEQFPGGPFVIDPRQYENFDPDVLSGNPEAYYLQQGRLHVIDKDSGNPAVPGAGAPGTHQFTGLAISNDQLAKAAAVDKTGGIWVTGTSPGSQWQRWIEGTNLTAPSWDRYGDVWSVSRQGPRKSQVLRAHDPSRQVPVSAPDLESTDVTAFRVARDGARVAVICDDGHGQRVLVGSINRTAWAVQNLHPLVPAVEDQKIVDIAWRDADTLLVLTKTKSGLELTPWSVTQGIRSDSAKPATHIENIAAAPETAPLLAGAADGEILIWDTQKRLWTTLLKAPAATPTYPLG